MFLLVYGPQASMLKGLHGFALRNHRWRCSGKQMGSRGLSAGRAVCKASALPTVRFNLQPPKRQRNVKTLGQVGDGGPRSLEEGGLTSLPSNLTLTRRALLGR